MILVNGVLIPVRRNLMLVLQTLYAHGCHGDSFWIDALCINQGDDEEWGAQVALMANIYQGAEEVLVWLGVPKEHGWKGWNDLSPKHNQGRPFRKSKRLPAFDLLESVPHVSSSRLDLTHWYQKHYLYRNNTDMTLAGQWKQVADICMVPYWDRIWIIQEIVLASKLTLLYGRGMCEWSRLHTLFDILADHTKSVDLSRWQHPTKRADGDIFSQIVAILRSNALRLYEQRNLHHSKPASSGNTPSPSLEPDQKESDQTPGLSLRLLLKAFGSSLCSDPRDKVYGMLGMAQDVNEGDIHISYTSSKSILHLFENVIQFQQRKHDPEGQSLISFARILQQSLLAPRAKGAWPSTMPADNFPGTSLSDAHLHSGPTDPLIRAQAFCTGKISSTFSYDGTIYIRRIAHRKKLRSELDEAPDRWYSWDDAKRTWTDHRRIIDNMPLFPPGEEPSKEVSDMIKLADELAAKIDLQEVFGKPFPTMWHEDSCSCQHIQADLEDSTNQAELQPLFFIAPQEQRILITQHPVRHFDLICRFDDPSVIAILRQRECCDTYEVISRAVIPPIPASKIGRMAAEGPPWPTVHDGVITSKNRIWKQQEKLMVPDGAPRRHVGDRFVELQLEMSTAMLQALTYPIGWRQYEEGVRYSTKHANRPKVSRKPNLTMDLD